MMKQIKRTLKRLVSSRYLLFRGNPHDNIIALTFDDGPHVEHTEGILKILRDRGIRATFFLIGKEAKKYPKLVKMMIEDRHEVANHSFLHLRVAGTADIEDGRRAIQEISGAPSGLFRPPWGKITIGRLLYAFFHKISVILWSFDSLDDKLHTPQELKDHVKESKIGPGEILLFHEDYKYTLEALPGIIDNLRARGFKFATISEMIEAGV